jgi:hypothetical protein
VHDEKKNNKDAKNPKKLTGNELRIYKIHKNYDIWYNLVNIIDEFLSDCKFNFVKSVGH